MSKSNDNPDIIFGEIYDKYCHSALEVALNVLNDEHLAQDACQMAFAYIAQNIDKATKEPAKIDHYVLKITYHFAIDVYRKNQKIRIHEIPIVDNDCDEEDVRGYFYKGTAYTVESFENDLLKKYDLIELWNSLDKMDDKNLVYIQEFYFADMTIQDIANKHKISEAAAKKRVYRSLVKLRKIFFKGKEPKR